MSDMSVGADDFTVAFNAYSTFSNTEALPGPTTDVGTSTQSMTSSQPASANEMKLAGKPGQWSSTKAVPAQASENEIWRMGPNGS